MKKSLRTGLRFFPQLLSVILAGGILVRFPNEAGDGIRAGISLLLQTVIPSLFPFLVLSAFLNESGIGLFLSKLCRRPVGALFRLNGYGFLPILCGLTGGYPVGAKTIAALYTEKKLTHNEAERLFFYCVNPGPAFTVTAVGSMMLQNTEAGLLLYAAAVLSALTTGFFCRFLWDGEKPQAAASLPKKNAHALVSAVSSASSSMLSISAWVLTFSAAGSLLQTLSLDRTAYVFLQSVLEITTGCRAAVGIYPLPAIAALLGFGGFSVIFQIMPYLNACGIELKRFLSARIMNAAMCAFFASGLLRLFPTAIPTSASITLGKAVLPLSFSVVSSLLLLLFSAFYILEVDNRKKV